MELEQIDAAELHDSMIWTCKRHIRQTLRQLGLWRITLLKLYEVRYASLNFPPECKKRRTKCRRREDFKCFECFRDEDLENRERIQNANNDEIVDMIKRFLSPQEGKISDNEARGKCTVSLFWQRSVLELYLHGKRVFGCNLKRMLETWTALEEKRTTILLMIEAAIKEIVPVDGHSGVLIRFHIQREMLKQKNVRLVRQHKSAKCKQFSKYILKRKGCLPITNLRQRSLQRNNKRAISSIHFQENNDSADKISETEFAAKQLRERERAAEEESL